MQQGLQYKNTLFFTSKILVLRWAGILRFLMGRWMLEERSNKRGFIAVFLFKIFISKEVLITCID